ncbi:hypothetical protein EAI_10235, partial [Harpegnathos saltator]
KENVTFQASTTKKDSKRGIREARAGVTSEILVKVRQDFVKRINKCLNVNGQQLEHLM